MLGPNIGTSKKSITHYHNRVKAQISGPYPQFYLNTGYNPNAYNGDKNNKYGVGTAHRRNSTGSVFQYFCIGAINEGAEKAK